MQVPQLSSAVSKSSLQMFFLKDDNVDRFLMSLAQLTYTSQSLFSPCSRSVYRQTVGQLDKILRNRAVMWHRSHPGRAYKYMLNLIHFEIHFNLLNRSRVTGLLPLDYERDSLDLFFLLVHQRPARFRCVLLLSSSNILNIQCTIWRPGILANGTVLQWDHRYMEYPTSRNQTQSRPSTPNHKKGKPPSHLT